MSARLTQRQFLQAARKVHERKYDYVNVQYVNSHTKIAITCAKHGCFLQVPTEHLSGKGCQKCGYERRDAKLRMTFNDFIRKSKEIHGTKFKYVEYFNGNRAKNIRKKATLICPHHGTFTQDVESHLNGRGCSACRESKGERAVRLFLKKSGIPFKAQARLIVSENRYSFDFQLLDRPTLIEFHGEQHYEAVDFSSRDQERADKQFKIRRKRDRLKARWAAENGYELLVIPYWENVEDVLTHQLLAPRKLAA